ncbi:MAG TPA: prepilin peptidase [Acidimicrobiales bacterium]|nr:prepilin peptidase [Acidimicrobiales bacterium]
MTGLLVGGCALLGLAIGSFLNVVIYRVPRKESVVRPGSACPSCGAPIANRDNVPVISWVLLRGHCRNCHAPISLAIR